MPLPPTAPVGFEVELDPIVPVDPEPVGVGVRVEPVVLAPVPMVLLLPIEPPPMRPAQAVTIAVASKTLSSAGTRTYLDFEIMKNS
ncbi:MAG: hypothetical protein AVDCRST_MAG51-3168 [uncultured Ramlibacter sp.]|uniref:Uncharacterized protein n=1 Tax=uncultured Ramlibacter sp. TaxID=260755 RepID=A0A6J4QJS4_9BURK|nr:MAG: hypothetical protein AVDCRST_MAG51-3168 [uncultured Ramlibacter sp.]